MDQLAMRWENVQKRIERACHRAGRDPNEIRVIAVTKYLDHEQTANVIKHGFSHIGESRVQNGMAKWKELGDRATWHFIGHLQRNKAKYIVGSYQYLHSLESLSLAKEIQTRADRKGVTMKCFIQVNVANESTKFGIRPQDLETFASEVSMMSGIELTGLMTMTPRVEDAEEVRPIFRELKRLQHDLQIKLNQPLPHLSMGMSQDFDVAIEEGATWVRLGTVLVK